MLKAVTWATGIAALALVNIAGTESATAQELSEKSVKKIMDYAWALVPQQFTPPNGGKTILIDKTKKSEVVVPFDVAKEVIRVGRLSAHAQVCDLPKAQLFNYRSMMQRELNKKTWSQQQLVYITQLHLTTMYMLTGKIKVAADKAGGKEVVIQESQTASTTCTEEQKKKVLSVISAYVDAGPEFKIAIPKAPPKGAKKTAETTADPGKKTADKKK